MPTFSNYRPRNVRKLSKRIVITTPARQKATRTIQRAFRRRRPYRKRGLYKNVTGNTLTVKCRVPFHLNYSYFTVLADDSLEFNFLNAPWLNIQSTGTGPNKFYNQDFQHAMQLYQSYKLSRIDYHMRRPDIAINNVDPDRAAETHKQIVSWGTEILHTRMVDKPDGTTGVLQATVDLSPRMVTESGGSTWRELVDNQDKRFHMHGTRNYVKRTWLPATFQEKKLRDKQYSDQEHICGGLSVRFKHKTLVPGLVAVPQDGQIMLEGYADVYMNFSRRT